MLGHAGHYNVKEGADFNVVPVLDFEGAPLGRNLARIAGANPSFAPYRDRFNKALGASNYDAADGIISKCLIGGLIVDWNNKSIYDRWRWYTERLEGLNVALYRAARSATSLHRFIGSLAELDNYRHGRWRRKGDSQDRVPTTVGLSNYILDESAVAKVTYDTNALRGWSQPVRYSPYPRNQVAECERFGHEKDGSLAGECEVHVHAACPIPAPKYIKITLLPRCGLGRQEAIERYGDVGVIE